jgi:RimJ/RimL family protein N-acetyltransferase
MHIRLAKEEDNKIVSKLLKNLQGDYYPYKMLSPAYVLEKIRFKNDFFFLAIETEPIGVLRASIVDIDLSDLRMMFVAEAYRKKGVGEELVKTALDFLKKKKMRKVIARAKADNTAAIKLFEKMGFKQEGYFKEHYRKGQDIVQMYLFL